MILAAVAALATSTSSIATGVAQRLPTNQSKATTLVGVVATRQRVAPAGARQAFRQAPYKTVKLKYLYAVGWVGAQRNGMACPFIRFPGGDDDDTKAMVEVVEHDAKLLKILRTSSVPVDVAASVLAQGMRAGCT